MPWELDPISSGAVEGLYASKQDIIDRAGEINLIKVSDLDQSGGVDDTRIQRALNYSDSRIHNLLRGFRKVPLTGYDADDANRLKDWSAWIAYFWLYDALPEWDEEGVPRPHPFREKRIEVEQEIQLCRFPALSPFSADLPDEISPTYGYEEL